MTAAAIPRFFLSPSSSYHRLLRFVHGSNLSCFPPFNLTPAFFLSSYEGRRHSTTALGIVFPCSFQRSPLPVFSRNFSSSSSSSNTNTTVSFDWSDDEDKEKKTEAKTKEIDKSKLPPLYDPFSKNPVVKEPLDPSNLQEIFHKMRTEGLTNNAIKMFDALSKDGLTHEALELFADIKDKGTMPDVVAHTAVLEAYANAGGHAKEAIRTYERMLASGVSPNAYTFAVLVKGLAKDGCLPEARKFVLSMMDRGMRPNAGTYIAVFKAYLRQKKIEEARALLDEMRGKGFVADERAAREVLGNRGQVFRTIMDLLFGK